MAGVLFAGLVSALQIRAAGLEFYCMTTDALREAVGIRRPFRITLADGRTLDVSHPEFVSISPSGRLLYIAEENDRLEALDVRMITGVQQERTLPR